MDKVDQVVKFLQNNPSYLKRGKSNIAFKLGCTVEEVKEAKDRIGVRVNNKEEYSEYVTSVRNVLLEGITNIERTKEGRVLIVGDLHTPFTRSIYLEFCKEVYDKYNCNEVIFIGDLIDNHFSSFHDTDPDGHGAAEELRLAKEQIQQWYKVFPKAKVCIGNHDLIPVRKAFNAGLSKLWIKPISEVLNTPNWEYEEEFYIQDVLYTHGTARKANKRMKADLISVVQGHYHSESYIEYSVGKFKKMFAMQVGCGVDDKSYAMAYGKHFDKMHINCGVVLENGTLPILEYIKL
jgi:metallophosphoesterase superfamily enzyme